MFKECRRPRISTAVIYYSSVKNESAAAAMAWKGNRKENRWYNKTVPFPSLTRNLNLVELFAIKSVLEVAINEIILPKKGNQQLRLGLTVYMVVT